MIVILVQTEDAEAADQVADCVETIGCEFVVLDRGVVTRKSADGGGSR